MPESENGKTDDCVSKTVELLKKNADFFKRAAEEADNLYIEASLIADRA